MKEYPILFNTEMVKAILDGTKTQTRRVIKSQPPKDYTFKGSDGGNPLLPTDSDYYWMNSYAMWRPKQKYQVGSKLWVRETWCHPADCVPYRHPSYHKLVLYRADDGKERFPLSGNWKQYDRDYKWKPSIHMPRWASRITLEITEVRVEQLNCMTESDAYLEGVDNLVTFMLLWDRLNKKRGYEWTSNCWVWVLTFKLCR